MLEFKLPQRMGAEGAAKIFAAYLQGPVAVENCGIRLYETSTNRWQIDGSNDFWLSVHGTTARLSCRNPEDRPVLDAMLTLFRRRYMPFEVRTAA